MPLRWTRWIFLLAAWGLVACGSHSAPPSVPATEPTTRSAPSTDISSTAPPATDSDPKDTLPYLASDQLQGRGVGLPGLDAAAQFIAGEFAADGLRPLPGSADFFQPFDYTTQAGPGPKTALAIGSQSLAIDADYLPMRFSIEERFTGPVVFVGYGMSAPEVGYDDYDGIDVKGKVVVAMRYEPMDAQSHSRLAPPSDLSGWSNHATFTAKTKAAADHGAAALLLVNPPDSEPDLLIPFSGTFSSPSTIPVLQIKQAVVNRLLAAAGAGDLKTLRAQIDASFKPRSMELKDQTVSGQVQIQSMTAHVKNVTAALPGTGPNAGEFVVVGAHYDHLGLGRLGGMFGPPGSIYHGADDNASGTSTVLELASCLAHAPPPPRTILFICFTAEEEGLIGSQYFIKHPPVSLDKIVAMVNLDMVGRIRQQTLYIGGQGTAKDFDAILGQADLDSPLKLKSIGRGGMGPSDHMSFAQRRIPVMFFFSGIHVDYHRPTDVAEKINFEGIGEVADFTAKVLTGLTRMPHEPYLVEADKDSMHLFGSPDFGPTPARRAILGIIPDYASLDSRVGVLISGTTPGTPADAAGLREGDLLVQFGPQKLENLMDLTQALANCKPGDRITIKLIRGTQTLSFDVTLAERKG
ncbi:MAG: M28 family peptidase [Tepidisphaeraceae bacterium]